MRSCAIVSTLAALAVAGCGGGDEGPSTEDYVAKADAICQEADRKQGRGALYGENFSDATFLTRHNAATKDALKRLRALDAPEADRREVDAVLAGIQGVVAAVDKQIVALRTKDLPRQSEASREYEAAYGNVASAAGTLGLSRCQSLAN